MAGIKADLGILEQSATEILFIVTVDAARPNVAYGVWVANKCFDGDQMVSAEYLPVRYPDDQQKPVAGKAGPFKLSGTRGEAYAWLHPDTQKPIRDTQAAYKIV